MPCSHVPIFSPIFQCETQLVGVSFPPIFINLILRHNTANRVIILLNQQTIFPKISIGPFGQEIENQLVRRQNLLVPDERTSVKILTDHS